MPTGLLPSWCMQTMQKGIFVSSISKWTMHIFENTCFPWPSPAFTFGVSEGNQEIIINLLHFLLSSRCKALIAQVWWPVTCIRRIFFFFFHTLLLHCFCRRVEGNCFWIIWDDGSPARFWWGWVSEPHPPPHLGEMSHLQDFAALLVILAPQSDLIFFSLAYR